MNGDKVQNSIDKFKAKREKRLRERLGERYDSVAEFHKRRNGRLVTRMDENPRLVYAVAKNLDIKTDGKSPKEVWMEIGKKDPSISVYNEPKRMDAQEPDDWITVKGNHIPVDKNNKPVGGQVKALGKKPDKEKIRQAREQRAKEAGYVGGWNPPKVKGMSSSEVHKVLTGCHKIGGQHYDDATQVAVDRRALRTFTTHGLDHIQQVIEKTNQAADEIEKIQGNHHFNPGKIDRKTMLVAAWFHDTGMDGGDKDWGDDNGDGIRGAHGTNSALHVLEHAKEIEEIGVNPSQVAFIAFAHTKSKSGINDLMSPSDWVDGLDRMEAAVKEYNDSHKGKEIKFDRDSVFGGEPNDSNIQNMAANVAAIRLGDANREANIELRSQTGGEYKIDKMPKPEQCTSWEEEVNNSTISITRDGKRHDLNDDNDDELGEMPQGDKNFSKRVVLGERNMVQVDTDYEEKYDMLQEEVTLRNGHDVPWSTAEAILERCGELNTINGVPRALKLTLTGVKSLKDFEGSNAQAAYLEMADKIKHATKKRVNKQTGETEKYLVYGGVGHVFLVFDDGTRIDLLGNDNNKK